MRACGGWAWYHPQLGMSKFFCGSMSCFREKCQKLFWSRRVSLISALIKEHDLKKFFTLTLDRGIIPPSVSPWDYVHVVWSKFRKRMRRRYSDFKFVAVLESHKNKSFPHIHGFTNVWQGQAAWSFLWEDCGGGRIVWVEAVKTPELSKYVSKEIEVARYVGKENLREAYKEKKHHRTLWRSEGLKAKFELDMSKGWSIIKKGVYMDDEVKLTVRHEYGVDRYGKKERSREDLERARRALFESGTQGCFSYMEAEVEKDKHEEGVSSSSSEGSNQLQNKEGTR